MNIWCASIIAAGLMIGGFLVGGRYEIVSNQGNEVARLDRFTGHVSMCVPGTKAACGWMLDSKSNEDNTGVGLPATLTDEQMRALENVGLATNSN